MTITDYFTPMARRVVFIVYEGFELLDMAGPAGAFTTADALGTGSLYRIVLASNDTSVRASGGISLVTQNIAKLRFRPTDTVMVMGAYGAPLARSMGTNAVSTALIRAAGTCERVASVCTGAFLLARTGLLNDRRATTHWAACDQFHSMFPSVQLEPDALYVQDQRFWTSAGVTAGIDMALAMIKQDHGQALAGRVARQLVVYAHRPGYQSQFSSILEVQTRVTGAFTVLIDWLMTRLDRRVTVAEMATETGMSERTFLRKFKSASGQAPSKYLEILRIEKARLLLEGGLSIKRIATEVGFKSEAAFRASFSARMGVSPSHYAKTQAGNEQRA